MKKYLILAMVVLTGIASSCKYDDDEVWDSVNDLAERVTSLEAVTKQMNSDIAALQSIVSALQKQVSVSEVETLADGYIIHFSDGTKATIKNGEDGKDGADGKDGEDGKDGADGKDGENGKDGADAPLINVAKYGDVYYWTITVDGVTEWLTDDAGNKLPVSGKDGSDGEDGASGSNGEDGNTPLLKVSSDGYWMVSYDNGSTYGYVKDENNNNVLAKGKDGSNGDSKFSSITSADGIVSIQFNGSVYEFPMVAAVTYTGEGYADGVVTVKNNSSVTLKYEVSNLGSSFSAEVISISDDAITASIDESRKELNIHCGGTLARSKIVILYYNANQTITSVLGVNPQNDNI